MVVNYRFNVGDSVSRTRIDDYWSRIGFEEPPVGSVGTVLSQSYAEGASLEYRIRYEVSNIPGYPRPVWLLESELELVEELQVD